MGKVFSMDRHGCSPAESVPAGLDACSDLAENKKVMPNLGQDQAWIC